MEATPNQGSQPSSIGNDPVLSAFAAIRSQFDVSEVPEATALQSADGSTVLTPQGPLNDLQSLRAAFPFLPILPFPGQARAVVTAQIGGVGDFRAEMPIPARASMVFLISDGITFVSRNGNAEVPTITNTVSPDDPQAARSFMLSPNGMVFFVGNVQSLAFASSAARIVSGMFYTPDQWPRY